MSFAEAVHFLLILAWGEVKSVKLLGCKERQVLMIFSPPINSFTKVTLLANC